MDSNAPHPSPLEWVVVANAARARIFVRDPDNGALRELSGHVHAASRLSGAVLGDDRPGQARKSAASTAFAPRQTPHEHERAAFAAELAGVLERAAADRRMPGWRLIASDPFLGVLKAHLGDGAARGLRASVPLDLSGFDGKELEQRVTRALASGG